MGKNKKENKPKKKAMKATFWIAGLLVTGLLAWGWIGRRVPAGDPNRDVAAVGGYVRRETRTPLSPALFVGQTARAYQVAWEIPEILDQLYCYCECDKHLGHVSLLSCFTDDHGATWINICQGEALDASQMAKQGYSVEQIRAEIDRKYGRL